MKAAVVLKRTAYRTYGPGDLRVRELLRRKDPTVARLLRAHEDHETTVREVEDALTSLGVHAKFVEAAEPLTGTFDDVDVVLTVGGDGTLLLASHRASAQTPILGINSAPKDSVGFFCAAKKGHVKRALAAMMRGKLPKVVLTRMQVELNGRHVHERVLNEALFCHASPAATSRYILRVKRGDDARIEEEEHRSSGIWIGPAAGSTAAQKSAGGKVLPLSSKRLQYIVREPYATNGGRIRLSRGILGDGGSLTVLCKMQTAKLFLDGVHTAFDCTLGDVVTFRRSPDPLVVFGMPRR
jgi:NAD+ kinase